MKRRATFVFVAYNNRNYLKTARRIIEVYKEHKHDDVPDTFIVEKIFPKFNIHISYRQWMNIKGMVIPKQETTNQLSLFN
ncbi:hypothetical protein SDC9_180853 [bioreactor metagenome]|uniref:Uncharacterized protein n=1 Tax=bioreactor metagenome TaxID=1076179 RepID=A0A645H2X1_9ZZZZ|nr:hypothetical protein [Chryseobacterium sp. R2A-55]